MLLRRFLFLASVVGTESFRMVLRQFPISIMRGFSPRDRVDCALFP